MKIMCSRARRLKIAISIYNPARGLGSDHCAEKDSGSRVRGSGSGYPVFGKALKGAKGNLAVTSK